MLLYRSLSALKRATHRSERVITIGAFDGIHLGHREILDRVSNLAAGRERSSMIFSFEPMPTEFFALDNPPARLTCLRERVEILSDLGIDEMFCPRFSAMRDLSHDRFIDTLLIAELRAQHIVVGHDFRFGAGRSGTVEHLERAAERGAFDLTVVPPVYLDGERVSSTGIRQLLGRGMVSQARTLLGRDYSMSGRVVHGRNLGRKLGFPTANVNLKRRLAPVDGIFAVQVVGLAEQAVDGVASVGSRPTIGGGKTMLEVFMFDFDRDIYGQYITVRFIARLREERKFVDLPSMQAQMRIDAEQAQAALKHRIA
jgi:riboflavin kinase/FMN adenylyltransferase